MNSSLLFIDNMDEKKSELIEYHLQQLSIAKTVEDRAAEGRAYCNLGKAYQGVGDFKQAIDYYEQHLSIAKEVGDRLGERCAVQKLGNAYQGLGDFKQAIEHHKQWLSIVKEVGDTAGEGQAYCNLGNACLKLGDLKQTIEYYKQHLNIAKELGDRAGEGCAYDSLGRAYNSVGDLKQAIEHHEQCLRISNEVGDRARIGRAYCHLGIDYHTLGDFEQATEYHTKYLCIAKELEDRAGEGNAYGNLGDIRKDLGDLQGGIEYYLQGLKIFEELGDNARKGHAYCKLGACYRRLGDLNLAKEYHKQHLEVAREVGDRYGEACACFSIGSDFELMDFLEEALDFYRCSVKVFNDMRCLLRTEDVWKVNFRNIHQHAYTALWRTLVRLSKTDEALCAAEQGRAQALMDLMELRYGLELLDLKEMASSIVSDVSSQIAFVALEGNKVNLWVLRKGNDVQFRQNEVEDGGAACFLEGLRKNALKENHVGRYVKCEDRSLENLREELTHNKESGKIVQSLQRSTNPLHLLYHDIFGPIANLLQGDEVVIVPDGPLCLTPFAAFVDDNSRYLSESFRIRIVPSLTSLKLMADCPEGYHSKSGALLVGDPYVAEIKKPKLAQLPCAREEVRMIGEILKTTPLTGKEATKDEVLKRISSVALVHIAAHGNMVSGEIALAPNPARKCKSPKEKDYILKIADVQAVQLRARLVVLSCCHSGKGEIKAEGVVGIARAFLGAGARSVLASLWAIDDEATMEFMKSFYQHLSDGNSASVSLNRAMKNLRESEKFSGMKYWAPFVLIGDDVTLEFEEKKGKHRK